MHVGSTDYSVCSSWDASGRRAWVRYMLDGYITYFGFSSTLAHSTVDEETNFFDGILDILCCSFEMSLSLSLFLPPSPALFSLFLSLSLCGTVLHDFSLKKL